MDLPRRDFVRDFGETLPARVATPIGRAAARDVCALGALAFRRAENGAAYRIVPGGETLRIEAGDDAPVLVELAEEGWRDFAAEMATAAGLFYGGRMTIARGTYADLERWEPALRALLCGRPIFDPDAVVLRDAGGAPLDPRRSFTLDAGDATLAHFLHETGHLHVRGVFERDEIARLADVVSARQDAARPGDGRSWWAKRTDGASVLCRLIYLGEVEPTIAALADDARLRRLMELVGERLRVARDRSDGQSVVIKNAGVVEGLSDLPWHRDCGLGGHPVTCPALNIGVQLDAATAETGRLHFVPGSWRASCHRGDLARATTVAIDTEPGDVTVHLGDVMHAAPPPTGSGPGRRALYLSCLPERAYDVIPAGTSYNDVILARVGR